MRRAIGSTPLSIVVCGRESAPEPIGGSIERPDFGVDRPLTEPRHWRRNTGRLVTVAVGPAGSTETVTGRVTAVDGNGVTLAVEAKGKPGAKKRPPTSRQVPWVELGSGRVQVEFGRGTDESLADDDLADDHLADDGRAVDDLADDDGGEE